ncbi:MAG: RNA methyltransferase [Thermaceae bacterium]|nr:RNA methyltransferase [Thermaceae bacterium]
MRITSTHNPRIKAVAQLKERKGREQAGRFLIEGAREIARALAAEVRLETVLISDSPLSLEERQVYANLARVERLEILEVSESAMKKLSSRENPANLIAVGQIPNHSLAASEPSKNALILVAVGLEKPGNLGAVLRSADAAGASAVLVAGGVDLYNPQVIRNSTGAVFSLPTVAASEEEVLLWLRQHHIPLVVSTPHTDTLFWQADLRGRVAIAVGPEHQGLSQEWLEAAQTKVRIPMQGQTDSLNVSVAAALLLYEAARQRS